MTGLNEVDFSNLNGLEGEMEGAELNNEQTPESDSGEERKAKSKKSKSNNTQTRAMVMAFQKALEENPDLGETISIWSEFLVIEHTLGFGETGSFIYDKEASAAAGKRQLPATSGIVGYRVRNIGDFGIPYVTEEYNVDKKNPTNPPGPGEKIERVIEPGKTVDIARKYFNLLGIRPEISFLFANGRITYKSVSVKPRTLEEELDGCFFTFNKGENKAVHADDVKINIGRKITDPKTGKPMWVVKNEFLKTFAFLNSATKSKPQFRPCQVNATYLRELMANRGTM